MSIPVFGLQAIKDKATRDAIYNLAQRAGTGDGSGGVAVEVQTDDPTTQAGAEGDIIYATGTGSIWIFVGTSWSRATDGTIATFVQVRSATYSAVNSSSYSVWNDAPRVFKNNGANGQQSVALIATIYEDGFALTDAEHVSRVNSYQWRKNGQAFSLSETPLTDTGLTSRAIIITADDVNDAGDDAFTCTIDFD